MQQKITFSEVCRIIADRTGLPRRDVDEFLRALFSTIASALAQGEQVRIKGIGTFKAQRMGERKSVDVNSGKVITLPAHTKLSFAPAKDLAAAVNAPFAAFEAVEITDDLTDEELEITDEVPATEPALVNTETPDTQTTTSQDEAGTISQKEDAEESAKEEETAGEELLEEAVPQEKISEEEVPQQEDETPSDEVSSDDTPSEEASSDEAPLAPFLADHDDDYTYIEDSQEPDHPSEISDSSQKPQPQPQPQSQPDEEAPSYPADALEAGEEVLEGENDNIEEPIAEEIEEAEREIRHKSRRRRKHRFGFVIGFICALLLICVVGILCLLLCPNAPRSIAELVQGRDTVEIQRAEVIDTPVTTHTVTALTSVAVSDSSVTEEKADVAPTEASDAPKVYDVVTTTRYLTTIARQHYGNQHFWPYIYEENKAILGHPNRIKPGTKVVVPDLKKYGVDVKNRKDIEEAKRKEVEIYARYNKSADKDKKSSKR